MELMVAIAILAIIAAIAIPSYRIFVKKAKMLEGEVALREIARLESHYFLNNSLYSDSLSALGFAPNPPLKYYTVQITLGAQGEPHLYQITATSTSEDLDSLVLTVYADGTDALQPLPSATSPPDKKDKPDKKRKPDKPDKPGKPDKKGKPDKPDKPGKPDK